MSRRSDLPGSGDDSHFFATLRVRPEIARTAADHAAAVSQCGTVPQRVKELCGLMVSALNGCEY